jgi:hypothetical protein
MKATETLATYFWSATLILAASTGTPEAVPAATPAARSEVTADFSTDAVGAEPREFVCVVGRWFVSVHQGKKVLTSNGNKWTKGETSPGLEEKAKVLYGEHRTAFMDSVRSFANFPLAICKDVDDFKSGALSVRFKPGGGNIDQAAGIVFSLKEDGDYLVVRANAIENNIALFKHEHGQRSAVKWTKDAPTASGRWHNLKVIIEGKSLNGYLDGKLYLKNDLDEPVSGKIGLWTNADSLVHFSDFQAKRNSK